MTAPDTWIPIFDRPPAERHRWAQYLRQEARALRQAPEMPADEADALGRKLYHLFQRMLPPGLPAPLVEQAQQEIVGHARRALTDPALIERVHESWGDREVSDLFVPAHYKALADVAILGGAGLFIEAGRCWRRAGAESWAQLMEAGAALLDADNTARGVKVRQRRDDGHGTWREERDAKHALWLEQARAMRATHPRITPNKAAGLIAEATGDPERTIRRVITPLWEKKTKK